MSSILLVKTSSLGDIVHNMPLVNDILAAFPQAHVDWMVENSFLDLANLHPHISHKLVVNVRQWRRALFQRRTWQEMCTCWQQLRHRQPYDYIIDTQALLKSALLARCVPGPVYGYAAPREKIARLFYTDSYSVPEEMHAVERYRRLAAAVLGYEVTTAFSYGLCMTDPPLPEIARHLERCQSTRYVFLAHGASKANKVWPLDQWRTIVHWLGTHRIASVLPWGSAAEKSRAEELATTSSFVHVTSRLSITQCAQAIAHAHCVVGQDTGLSHLAVALARPTIGLYIATNPDLSGLYPNQSPVINLGRTHQPPREKEVIAALEAYLEYSAA